MTLDFGAQIVILFLLTSVTLPLWNRCEMEKTNAHNKHLHTKLKTEAFLLICVMCNWTSKNYRIQFIVHQQHLYNCLSKKKDPTLKLKLLSLVWSWSWSWSTKRFQLFHFHSHRTDDAKALSWPHRLSPELAPYLNELTELHNLKQTLIIFDFKCLINQKFSTLKIIFFFPRFIFCSR